MRQFRILTACVALLPLLPFAALGQGAATSAASAFPLKPIRLIIPYAAGGPSDIIGRVLGQKMSELLGQPVLADNRPGAGGTLGADLAANAAPDGYTLVVTSLANISIAPILVRNLPYDPVQSFTAVGGVAWAPNILVINMSLPFKSLRDILDYAKANPGKLTYASAGVGTIGHLSGELLRTVTKVDLIHVPYKSSGVAYPDVMGGAVSMVFDTLPSAIKHVQAGKVRAIAVLSAKRSPLLPEVPTFAEAGFPEATLGFWFGLHGPANLPPVVLQRLNETLLKALAANDLRERMTALGADPYPTSPQEFSARIREDLEQMRKLAQAAGIQPQ